MLMRSDYGGSLESHRETVTAANKDLPRTLLPTFNMVNIFTRREGKLRNVLEVSLWCSPLLMLAEKISVYLN